jgi:3-oxoadipate enol-lactonase
MLLHGWLATADLNWAYAYGALRDEFRVVALDQRGHGRGIAERRTVHLEDCADDAMAVADVLGIERFCAVGYSMGGPVAMLARRRHRDRVSALVLCATTMRFAQDRRTRAQFAALGGLAATLRRVPEPWARRATRDLLVEGRAGHGPRRGWIADELRPSEPSALLSTAAALGGFDAGPWRSALGCPTSVVVTDDDRLIAPARQLEMVDGLPHARAFHVAGGHTVCFDAPERFNEVLLDACRAATA